MDETSYFIVFLVPFLFASFVLGMHILELSPSTSTLFEKLIAVFIGILGLLLMYLLLVTVYIFFIATLNGDILNGI